MNATNNNGKRHNPERKDFRGLSYRNMKRLRDLRAASHLASHLP